MRERGSARYFIENNSCPKLINSHWSFPSLFFEFSLGLNHFNYFFDVVLTETLECFKNISMFCGMKVRLQRRLFSLSLDEDDKLKVRSAVAWKSMKGILSTRLQSKAVVFGGRWRNCWAHTSNFTHGLVVLPHGEVKFWVLLH